MKTKKKTFLNSYELFCIVLKSKQDLRKFRLNLFSGYNKKITAFTSRDDECESDSDEDDVYFPPDNDGNIFDIFRQWNLSKADTISAKKSVRFIENEPKNDSQFNILPKNYMFAFSRHCSCVNIEFWQGNET